MDRTTLLEAMRLTANPAPVPVDTDEWGRVYVRALTVAEVEEQSRDEAAADGADAAAPRDASLRKHHIARGAARVLCDAAGHRLFDPENRADVELLAAQPWPLLQRVVKAGDRYNGRSAAGVADAKND